MENSQKLLTRRDFIRGTVGATLAVSVLGVPWAKGSEKTGRSSLVTIVRDKNVMDDGLKVDSKILQSMLDQTVKKLSGKTILKQAWAEFIKPDDIVGLVPIDQFLIKPMKN